MSQNVQGHTLNITFTDVTGQLDGAYGLEYLIFVQSKCLGQWVTQWSDSREDYTDWGGGLVMSHPFGVDPYQKWRVTIAPLGNDHCHLPSGSHCEVSAGLVVKEFSWTVLGAVVNIPWNVSAET